MFDNYNFELPDSPGDEESEDHPFVKNLNFDKLENYYFLNIIIFFKLNTEIKVRQRKRI